MSIASEITRLQGAKTDLKTAIENKGVLVPSSALLDDYDTYVGQIQTGGGGTNLQVKSVTITTNGTTNVTPDTGYDGMTAVEVITNVSGGITPTGTINIGSNGTYDVTNYASASVTVPPTQYVVAGSSAFTISVSNWVGDIASISLSSSSYTVDTSKIQIGIPTNSSSSNTLNIVNAGLSIYDAASSYVNIKAVNVPTTDIQILLFGVEANS